MPSKTYTLTTCDSYEAAHRMFEKPGPRGRVWADNERPLGDNRQQHYRVARNYDGSYSVILYRTTMARYYPPAADGSYRIDLTWDGRVTSSGFMHSVVQQSRVSTAATSCGRNVWRVIRHGACNSYTYDAQHRLILDQSHQEIVQVNRVNPAKTAWSKQARDKLAPLTMLLELRVDAVAREAENDAPPRYRSTTAFQSDPQVDSANRALRHFDALYNDWADFVEPLRRLYDAATVALVNTRRRKDEPIAYGWRVGKEVAYVRPKPKDCTMAFMRQLVKNSQIPEKISVKTEMWPDADKLSASSIL